MVLEEKEKNEFRKIIEKKLINVPNGKKIFIATDILEQLLFDEVYSYNEQGSLVHEGYKYIAWSGEFLSKIDLSSISFDKVLWGYFGEYDEDFYINNCDGEIEINMSYTNAKIDFSKSARRLKSNYNSIINCNFEGTALSNNILSLSNTLINSNFEKTGVKFKDKVGVCLDCNLSGSDLSKLTISQFSFTSDDYAFNIFTNLTNTGLKIVIEDTLDEDNNDYLELIKLSMSLGNLDGCYLNGELITPSFRKSSENRTFLSDIDSQIKKYIK